MTLDGLAALYIQCVYDMSSGRAGSEIKVEGKHGLSPDEVEWAILDRRAYIRLVWRNRYFVFGRSDAGAYIVPVVDYARGNATVISARTMTPQERRTYQRRGK